MIDTHCHLDFPEFKNDLKGILERAKTSGVNYFINVASSIEGCLNGDGLSKTYPQIYSTCGIHPHYADKASEEDIQTIKSLVQKNKKIIAIGEVGLDYFRDHSSRANQRKLFKKFIHLKNELELPIVIHSRQAKDDVLKMLTEESHCPINGVMHCFSEDTEYLKKILDLGLHVSFTCNITYKNAEPLRQTAKCVPLDRLLLETDAPFLSPQDLRGKRNEPANLTYLVAEFSNILNVSAEEIKETTTRNAKKLFGIG